MGRLFTKKSMCLNVLCTEFRGLKDHAANIGCATESALSWRLCPGFPPQREREKERLSLSFCLSQSQSFFCLFYSGAEFQSGPRMSHVKMTILVFMLQCTD